MGPHQGNRYPDVLMGGITWRPLPHDPHCDPTHLTLLLTRLDRALPVLTQMPCLSGLRLLRFLPRHRLFIASCPVNTAISRT